MFPACFYVLARDSDPSVLSVSHPLLLKVLLPLFFFVSLALALVSCRGRNKHIPSFSRAGPIFLFPTLVDLSTLALIINYPSGRLYVNATFTFVV